MRTKHYDNWCSLKNKECPSACTTWSRDEDGQYEIDDFYCSDNDGKKWSRILYGVGDEQGKKFCPQDVEDYDMYTWDTHPPFPPLTFKMIERMIRYGVDIEKFFSRPITDEGWGKDLNLAAEEETFLKKLYLTKLMKQE